VVVGWLLCVSFSEWKVLGQLSTLRPHDSSISFVAIYYSVVDDFRSEVDLSSWVAVVVELDWFLEVSVLVEGKEWDLSFSNVDSLLASVYVEDLDVEVVGEQVVVNGEVLVLPLCVFAAVVANWGGPFLVTNSEVDDWVHLVEETTFVVFEVSVDEM